MFANPTRIAFICLLAIALTSCSSEPDDKPTTIAFTSSEVAKLLGIKEGAGIKFGEITSNRDGVKVASIELDDKSGRELEADDLEIKIASPEKLVYAVSSLRIGTIDIHDWKNSQRTRAFDLSVSSPGENFIAAIKDAIASVQTGGVLKTSRLSFSQLAIGRIEYLVHKNESVTKVSLEKLSLDDAKEKTLGKFAIARIAIGETVGVENLKFTQVDRKWIDQLLTLLLKVSQADLKPSDWSPAEGKSGVVVPFDQFSVDRLTFRFDVSPRKAVSVTVSDLELDVNRTSRGGFAGLSGFVNVSVPANVFADKDGDGAVLIRDLLGQSSDSLALSVQLGVTFDPDSQVEKFDKLVVEVPAFGTISGSAQTQGLSQLLSIALLYAKGGKPPDIQISSLHVKYQDAGLIAYLLSNRYKDNKSVNKALEKITAEFPDATQRGRLRREVAAFKKSPGAIELDVDADDFVSADRFFETLDRKSLDPKSPVRINLKFADR
jgi:hypothetical protein